MSQFLEYLKMAVSNIKANKMRSFLTMLGIIIGISSVILIMSLGNGARNVITEEMLFTLGDINKDGKVDVLDARMILRKNASREEFTPDEISAGDVTWDGKVDVFDARKILMYSAKLIQSFEKK